MASQNTEATGPQLPTFRPGKKRKAYRQRATEDETEPQAAPVATDAPLTTSEQISALINEVHEENAAGDESRPVSEALRLSRSARHRARLGGVAFRAGSTPRAEEDAPTNNTEQSLVPVPDPIVAGIRNRFAPQTGMVGELINKHMEEYIESELTKRQRQRDAAEAAANADTTPHNPPSEGQSTTMLDGKPVVAQQSAMTGKLMEIDLGDEARARNIAETERARRRLEGQPDIEVDSDGRPRKVRLGRDGKPWRGRHRRNSEDIKRDQLVEEFLRENRLDVYDHPVESQSAVPGEDMSADDRIAEEFRREFMDAMIQRQQRRKPATNAKPVGKGAKAAEEVLKGPKLGGSRNSRAAMRDLLLRQQEGKK